MACPPALAMAEAERMLPAFVTDIEGCWQNTVWRMTPSSSGSPAAPTAAAAPCWRKWVWWARRRVATTLHLGQPEGTRIPRLHLRTSREPQILAELDALIGRWARSATGNECFGDFVIRAGIIAPGYRLREGLLCSLN